MSPVEQMRYLVLAAQRQGERTLTTLFKEIGITPSQAEALRVIADHAPLNLKELGERLVCEGGSPSRLLSSLVQKKLVLSTETKKDRRIKTLQLSTQGKKLMKQIISTEKKFYAAYESKADPALLTTIAQGLHKLIDDPQLSRALELRGVVNGLTKEEK